MLGPKLMKQFLDDVHSLRDVTGRLHAVAGSIENLELMNHAGRVYKPHWYKPEEFLPPAVHTRFGDAGLMFVDNRMLWTMDAIREYFAPHSPVNVNTWCFGGNLVGRGFRMPDYGVPNGRGWLSQHKLGRGIDFNIDGIPSDEVFQEITTHPNEPAFGFITRIEHPDLTPTWTHIDNANTNIDRIHVIETA